MSSTACYCYRAGHLNPGRYKQNKLRETLTRMARTNKKTLPEGVGRFMHPGLTTPPVITPPVMCSTALQKL